MTREEIMQAVRDTHVRRTDNACKAITDTDNATDARLVLETAVRVRPGVSGDPGTVHDLLSMVDSYVDHLWRMSGTG